MNKQVLRILEIYSIYMQLKIITCLELSLVPSLPDAAFLEGTSGVESDSSRFLFLPPLSARSRKTKTYN